MLNMTSGIYSYTEDEAFGAAFDADPTATFPPSAAIEIIKAHEPDSAPGQGWHYSDSNYLLLGVIASKVTGQPLDALMEDLVTEPLGLDHTSYPTSTSIPRPRIRGYLAQPDGSLRDVTAVNPTVAAGAGAIIRPSTIAPPTRRRGPRARSCLGPPSASDWSSSTST